MDILKQAENVISDYASLTSSKAEFDKLKGDCEVSRLIQYLLDKGQNVIAEIDKLTEQETPDSENTHFLDHYLKIQELICINSTIKYFSDNRRPI